MPKFRVKILQSVIEEKIVEIEADSEEAAWDLGADEIMDDGNSFEFSHIPDRWIEDIVAIEEPSVFTLANSSPGMQQLPRTAEVEALLVSDPRVQVIEMRGD